MTADAATRVVRTTCYQCTVECGFDATLDAGGRIVELHGPECERGAAQLEVQYHPDRLRTPLLRQGEDFVAIGWDEALDRIADALTRTAEAHGPEAVAFVAGYTKEVRPYLQRLAHTFGSPNYMTESSCCYSATHLAAETCFGRGHGRYLGSGRRKSDATRCLLVWSTNPFSSALPFEQHRLMTAEGPALVVVDPRRTPLAERAAVHLQIRPGTDGALALGMHHVLFREGWTDAAALARCHGVEAFAEYVAGFDPGRVAGICGVAAEDVERAAELYAGGPSQIVTSPNSTVHHSNGTQGHRAIVLLSAVTGNVFRDGGNRLGLPSLKGASITRFERIGDLAPRIGAARFPAWSAHYAEAQTMLLPDAILDGEPYPVRAVFGIGVNRMMWPDSRRMERALRALDFFVTSDFFHTPTTRLADLVLPAATSLEREALLLKPGGTVILRQAATTPEGEARGDTDVVLALAVRLGLGAECWDGDRRAAFAARLAHTGVTVEELLAHPHGVQATLPEVGELTFPTPTGKIELTSETLRELHGDEEALPVWREPAESPVSTPEVAADFPLVLTSGGRARSFTHSQHRNIASLRAKMPEPLVDVHPDDAAARGIADGDRVALSSPRGEIRLTAHVTDTIRRGTVHVLHGWAEADVNELVAGDQLDPLSGFPPFKSSLCQVRKG